MLALPVAERDLGQDRCRSGLPADGGCRRILSDLLVVMRVDGCNRQQAVRIDLALEGTPIPIDLSVVTPEEVEKHRDAMGTIIREAVREGKAMYERPA